MPRFLLSLDNGIRKSALAISIRTTGDCKCIGTSHRVFRHHIRSAISAGKLSFCSIALFATLLAEISGVLAAWLMLGRGRWERKIQLDRRDYTNHTSTPSQTAGTSASVPTRRNATAGRRPRRPDTDFRRGAGDGNSALLPGSARGDHLRVLDAHRRRASILRTSSSPAGAGSGMHVGVCGSNTASSGWRRSLARVAGNSRAPRRRGGSWVSGNGRSAFIQRLVPARHRRLFVRDALGAYVPELRGDCGPCPGHHVPSGKPQILCTADSSSGAGRRAFKNDQREVITARVIQSYAGKESNRDTDQIA